MSRSQWVFIIILIIVIGAGVFLFKDKLGTSSTVIIPGNGNTVATTGEASEYQAVFLVNNQVYFGKLTDEQSQYPVLHDIYYLQVNQQIQPVQDGKNAQQQTVNDVSLIKLGGEIHGPTDEMRINRDQILLIENLRADSNVVKAIKAYKATPATAPAAKP